MTTDVEVIDDYPSHYSAYTRRKHRWLRATASAQWLLGEYKISPGGLCAILSLPFAMEDFDNLRRSLVSLYLRPTTRGLARIARRRAHWTAVTLCLMFVPRWSSFFFA